MFSIFRMCHIILSGTGKLWRWVRLRIVDTFARNTVFGVFIIVCGKLLARMRFNTLPNNIFNIFGKFHDRLHTTALHRHGYFTFVILFHLCLIYHPVITHISAYTVVHSLCSPLTTSTSVISARNVQLLHKKILLFVPIAQNNKLAQLLPRNSNHIGGSAPAHCQCFVVALLASPYSFFTLFFSFNSQNTTTNIQRTQRKTQKHTHTHSDANS